MGQKILKLINAVIFLFYKITFFPQNHEIFIFIFFEILVLPSFVSILSISFSLLPSFYVPTIFSSMGLRTTNEWKLYPSSFAS